MSTKLLQYANYLPHKGMIMMGAQFLNKQYANGDAFMNPMESIKIKVKHEPRLFSG